MLKKIIETDAPTSGASDTHKFKIGDIIKVKKDYSPYNHHSGYDFSEMQGATGIIRGYYTRSSEHLYIVEMLTYWGDWTHKCDKTIKNGHGRYFNDDEIEPYTDTIEVDGFRIGDRVSYRGIKSSCATIAIINSCGNIGVVFDTHKGHDLNGWLQGKAKGFGWWAKAEALFHIDTAETPTTPLEWSDKPYAKPQEISAAKPHAGDTAKKICEEIESTKAKTEAIYISQIPEIYIYIARDKDGKLFAYVAEPVVDICGEQYYGEKFKKINDKLFPDLKFKHGAKRIREAKIDE